MSDPRALSSNTEKLPELLREHAQIAYRNGAAAMNSSKSITDITPIESVIESLFAALQSENERLQARLDEAHKLRNAMIRQLGKRGSSDD